MPLFQIFTIIYEQAERRRTEEVQKELAATNRKLMEANQSADSEHEKLIRTRISLNCQFGDTKENTASKLKLECGSSQEEVEEKIRLYWK